MAVGATVSMNKEMGSADVVVSSTVTEAVTTSLPSAIAVMSASSTAIVQIPSEFAVTVFPPSLVRVWPLEKLKLTSSSGKLTPVMLKPSDASASLTRLSVEMMSV